MVEVRDIIATLDPRRLDDARSRTHDTFRDQLDMADAVALTMLDQSTPEQLGAAHAFVAQRWPPRKWVQEAPQGELPIGLLTQSGRAEGSDISVPANHQQLAATPSLAGSFFDFPPPPGKPQRETGTSLGYTSTGLRWHPSERFDLDSLATCLGELPREARIKGVFHTDSGWKRFNRAGGTLSVESSAWRQDSRLEVILPDTSPALDIEGQLRLLTLG